MMDAHDQVTPGLPGITPRWLQLLRQAVREAGKGGVSKVAQRLIKPAASPSSVGRTYNRSYVSQVINGHQTPEQVSPHFQASVLAAYGGNRIECPHLKTDIAQSECHRYCTRSYGAIEAADVPHWRACQGCLSNPANLPKPTPTSSTQ